MAVVITTAGHRVGDARRLARDLLLFLSSFCISSSSSIPLWFSLFGASQNSITNHSNPPLSHSNFHYFPPFSSLFSPLLAYSSIKTPSFSTNHINPHHSNSNPQSSPSKIRPLQGIFRQFYC